MRRTTTTTVRVGLLAAVLVTAGCSIGGFAPETSDAGGDAGPGAEIDGGTVEPGPDGGDGDGGTGGRPDTGPPPEQGPPPVQAFEACAAGGVASGGGVRAIQCLGPWQVAGGERAGSDGDGQTVRWQPGAFRGIADD